MKVMKQKMVVVMFALLVGCAMGKDADFAKLKTFGTMGKEVCPLKGDTEAERRAKPWPGYHTERYGVDVRH